MEKSLYQNNGGKIIKPTNNKLIADNYCQKVLIRINDNHNVLIKRFYWNVSPPKRPFTTTILTHLVFFKEKFSKINQD